MVEFAPAAHGKRGPEWVKKTDIVRYERCPYAFWLLDTKQVRFRELINAVTTQRLAEGVHFEDSIVEAADLAPEKPLSELFHWKKLHLLRVPLIENARLKIYGRPDGVDTAEGLLAPIEVKHHRDVTALDRLELAFYWMLLEPYRTRGTSDPCGVLYLPRADSYEAVEVELREGDFRRVRDLIELVRAARQNGVQPQHCTCEVCASRLEVAEVLARANSPSLLLGVGPKRAHALERIEIATLDDLLGAETEAIVSRLKSLKHFVSASGVEAWKHHARALKSGRPVWFGSEPLMFDRYIIVDLEYNPGGEVWLTGVHIEDGQDVQTLQFWGDGDIEMRAALDTLKDIVVDYGDLPIVTWKGESADVPALLAASRRYRLRSLPAVFQERHFDMCAFAMRNVRFPIASLGLKEVAAFYGYQPTTSVAGGMDAQFLYFRYRDARSKKVRAEIRNQLEAYNRDDLLATRHCIQQMQALASVAVTKS